MIKTKISRKVAGCKPREDVIRELMKLIRTQFCGDVPDKEWFKAHYQFIKVNVVLWPARFMSGKGFAVSPERYQAILEGIFEEVKRHGDTAVVRYWPGYLTKCVQDHFGHHWEEYYAEAKSLRAQAESAMLAMGSFRTDYAADGHIAGERAMEAMAATQRLLARGFRRGKGKRSRQGELGL